MTVTEDPIASFSSVALGGGRAVCYWIPDSSDSPNSLRRSEYQPEREKWSSPQTVEGDFATILGMNVIARESIDEIWMISVEGESDGLSKLTLRRSENNGLTWSESEPLKEISGKTRLGSVIEVADGGIAIGIAVDDGKETKQLHVIQYTDNVTGSLQLLVEKQVSEPILIQSVDSEIFAYFTYGENPRRYFRKSFAPGYSEWDLGMVNLPSAITNDVARRTADLIPLPDGRVVALCNDNVLRTGELSFRVSHDGGRTWPERRIIDSDAPEAKPRLILEDNGGYHAFYLKEGRLQHLRFDDNWALAHTRLETEPMLANVVPSLDSEEYVTTRGKPELPIEDKPFWVHVRVEAGESDWDEVAKPGIPTDLERIDPTITTPRVNQKDLEWVGTEDGLYMRSNGDGPFERYPTYGFEGPLSNHISGLAVDSRDVLWVATPAGLSSRNPAGEWSLYRGREGLPWENLTCIAIDPRDRLWLGSTRGLIQFRPYHEGRQWFYRAGERFLPGDHVFEVAIADKGKSVLSRTDQGVGRIDEVKKTLYEKAEYLEERYNDRHRRLGLASLARYTDESLGEWEHGSQASDGLWTSYHVTAMSLAYSLTQEDRYRKSAEESMEALYLLQNITGIKGLVARTMAEVGTPAADAAKGADNWHAAPDPRYIWRDDVSSDQIDGHYMAFYSYYEHIAQFDPEEREKIEKQIRQVTDYILDHNYQIIDWDGERTLWGWWNPELLNEEPNAHIEAGLYSLMMISFLKVAYTITDDSKYLDHVQKLIQEHGYLSNLLLQKKLFPNELNHSDDQLSAVAFYPIMQLEYNPTIRDAIRSAARHHAVIEEPERNSLFALVYASMEPQFADVEGALQTLREFPVDRRNYGTLNSHRADVILDPRASRRGQPLLIEVLPYDEHYFERWNQDPYRADNPGDGLTEGSGEHYLLPYWLARYHGVLTEPTER